MLSLFLTWSSVPATVNEALPNCVGSTNRTRLDIQLFTLLGLTESWETLDKS
jgi:hypothetical protein